MDIGAILLLLAMVIVVAGFILKPFREGGPDIWEEDLRLSELQAERERVLGALVELDFDNELGKVPEEIYAPQRKALLAQGAAVMQLLEEEYPDQARGDAIEAQIEARRKQIEDLVDEDDPLERIIQQRRSGSAAQEKPAERPAGKARFCPECGLQAEAGDKFCTACGTKL